MIFSPGKKWENIFWNPKVFYPTKKFFTPLFRNLLEYFVSIFGLCEKIIDFGLKKFIFSKFFKLCVYGSYLVFTNSNHLIWTPKPFYATSCHVWESWIFVWKIIRAEPDLGWKIDFGRQKSIFSKFFKLSGHGSYFVQKGLVVISPQNRFTVPSRK